MVLSLTHSQIPPRSACQPPPTGVGMRDDAFSANAHNTLQTHPQMSGAQTVPTIRTPNESVRESSDPNVLRDRPAQATTGCSPGSGPRQAPSADQTNKGELICPFSQPHTSTPPNASPCPSAESQPLSVSAPPCTTSSTASFSSGGGSSPGRWKETGGVPSLSEGRASQGLRRQGLGVWGQPRFQSCS